MDECENKRLRDDEMRKSERLLTANDLLSKVLKTLKIEKEQDKKVAAIYTALSKEANSLYCHALELSHMEPE